MFYADAPKTKEEAEKVRYGSWAGNSRGHAYNPYFCAMEIQGGPRGFTFYQCNRKNGHGPEGLYCKQHAKKIQE